MFLCNTLSSPVSSFISEIAFLSGNKETLRDRGEPKCVGSCHCILGISLPLFIMLTPHFSFYFLHFFSSVSGQRSPANSLCSGLAGGDGRCLKCSLSLSFCSSLALPGLPRGSLRYNNVSLHRAGPGLACPPWAGSLIHWRLLAPTLASFRGACPVCGMWGCVQWRPPQIT